MKVFLAGASGAIGRPLIGRLIESGHEVTGMTRSEDGATRIRALGAEAAICDVFDRERLLQAVTAAGAEAVVHQLTDLPHETYNPRRLRPYYARTHRLRTEGTANLLAAARAAGAGRFIAQSISFIYAPEGSAVKSEDDPLWEDAPAGMAEVIEGLKELDREVTGAEGMTGVVLRYGYFYGPGTWFADDAHFAREFRRRRMPIVGSGRGVWSFIHIDDAASATVAALERGAAGVYNVVDDDPAETREWMPVYAEAVGAPKPLRVPRLVARIAAGPLADYSMTRQRGASNAKARRELAWEPHFTTWRTGFHNGLA